ncbi:MAG: hypothetical protein ABWZ40_13450 [Caulobacterales bacterium]
MIRIAVACAALLTFAGSATAKPVSSKPPALKPIALTNPEDLLPLPGGRWVIASSMAGGPAKSGALYAIDSKTRHVKKIYPAGQPDAAEKPGCGRELASDVFSAHGVSFRPDAQGGGKLLVVNHGGRESVEIFDLQMGKTSAAAPSLKWDTCMIAPEGMLQNSVTSTPDGAIYTTMTSIASMQEMVKGQATIGDVRVWTAGKGWRIVPDSETWAPNGIIATPDGGKLYVSAWAGEKILELTLGDKPSRRALPLRFSPDNLRWAPDGAILAAGHDRSTTAKIGPCFMSEKAECPVESLIGRIDPVAFSVTCTHAMGQTFNTAAVTVGDELWLGAARGVRILRIPASTLTECAR